MMNAPDSMVTTSSQVIERLRQENAGNEFRWTPEGFTAGKDKSGKDKYYRPDELEILKTYRFEGASDPSDMEIIYVIRAHDGLVGYSLGAYGAYSSHDNEAGYDNFIRQIPERGHDQQLTFEL